MTLESKNPRFDRSAVHPYLLVRREPTRPLKKRPNRKIVTEPDPAPVVPVVPVALRQTREYGLGIAWYLEARLETFVRNVAVAVALAAQERRSFVEGFQRGMAVARENPVT